MIRKIVTGLLGSLFFVTAVVLPKAISAYDDNPALETTTVAPSEQSTSSVKSPPNRDQAPHEEPVTPHEEPVISVTPVSDETSSAPNNNVVAFKTADDVAKSPNETVFTTMSTQNGVTWGLDRVDGTVDGTYRYISDGSGVRIYIVDTGVDATHRDFGSRVADGFDAFGQNLDQTDCNGHGTHVAGIAAGGYFGVAKSATIVPVRVMDCNGVGNTTTLTDGIDWIIASHRGGVGIVNMSLGGGLDQEVNSAASRLVDAGLVVVAAAGNSNSDACNFSPASARGVIAVGAIDQTDSKSSFSNWGSCVDISAPGTGINSANSLNHSISLKKSGTSQAAPFVAGAIATYVSSGRVPSGPTAETYMDSLSDNGVVRVESEPEIPVEPTPEPIVEPEPELVEPEPSEPPVVDEPIVPEPEQEQLFVQVTQGEVGSGRAVLEWSQLTDAEGYKIYKTSTIRPGWRQYASVSEAAYYRNVIDKPGSIAIYRVVAMISGKEVEIGTFEYFPE